MGERSWILTLGSPGACGSAPAGVDIAAWDHSVILEETATGRLLAADIVVKLLGRFWAQTSSTTDATAEAAYRLTHAVGADDALDGRGASRGRLRLSWPNTLLRHQPPRTMPLPRRSPEHC